jgi:hypothetical protein
MDNDGSASALSSGSNKSIKDNSENEEKLLVAEDLSSTFVPLQIMNKSVLMSLLYPKSTSCVLTNIKDPIISNIINNPTMKQVSKCQLNFIYLLVLSLSFPIDNIWTGN